MTDNMTSEQRPGISPQDDSGVGAANAGENQSQLIGPAISPAERSILDTFTEITRPTLDADYQKLRTFIQIYKRDLGVDPIQIDEEEKSIKPLENVKKSKREELMKDAARERQRLAIEAFPRYLAAWREADAENESVVRSFENMFEQAGSQSSEAQVAVVDETRSQLSTILSIKGTYYTEMFTTLLVDGGFSPDQAEEQVLLKAPPVGDTVSIPERAQNLRDLKTAAIDYLVNDSLDTTIEAWDALYPGLGEEAEMRILSARGHDRTRLAKDLYKKVYTEIERRRGEFQDRTYISLKAQGKSSHEAHFEAREIDFKLRNLPRSQQIRIMRLNEPIPQLETGPADPTQQAILNLYLGIANKFERLDGEDNAELSRRLRDGLSNPDTREATYKEIDDLIKH